MMSLSDVNCWGRRVLALARWRTRFQSLAFGLATAGFGTQAYAGSADVSHVVQGSGIQVEHATVVVERLSDGQTWISNAERAGKRYSPASTSKIPHTLIALEGGFAKASTVYHWDGVVRGSRKWNQDQTLKSAFQNSAVWVYQDIARTAGHIAMSKWLAGFEYGDSNVGSIDHLTTYWLDGTLKISAVEQVEFLAKLAFERLPLSKVTFEAANDIMVSDADINWIMRSKTGWRHSKDSMDIGWHVGWVQCSDETFVFAMNMDMPDTRYLSKRKQTSYAVLEAVGAFDCD